ATTLADPEVTRLVVVTVPEELPTTETLETLDWLDHEQVTAPPTVVVNRVLPVLDVAERPSGVAGDMVDLHRSLVAEQQMWLDRLPGDVQLPYLFGVFTPGEVAASLSEGLEP